VGRNQRAVIAKAGAWAIATTSSGQSWSLGVPRRQPPGVDVVLGNVRWIVTTVNLTGVGRNRERLAGHARGRARHDARFPGRHVGVNVEDSGAADGGL
jgi:2-methylisocitrate lyase-like PEP mutase family enzyme